MPGSGVASLAESRSPATRVASSFRDPSGFLFWRDGALYRQVQPAYASSYQQLKSSGLYDALVAESLLVPHQELGADSALTRNAFCVLRPEVIPVVSFPYEWCFGQLKAAAELTLRVQELALAHGMTLRDASAYNVQFRGTSPVFVDTLSFGPVEPGKPWIAYRQFVQHFLAPLALQSYVDARLRELTRSYLDGVPLDLASRLLPFRTWLRPWALAHIHLHARAIAKFSSTRSEVRPSGHTVSAHGMIAMVKHLQRAVQSLESAVGDTEWGDYEQTHGYTQSAAGAKHDLVRAMLEDVKPVRVVDLGANTGEFARIARAVGADVVAVDGDPAAVERAYQRLHAVGEQGILPLWIDLANPSPSQGWAHGEWTSLSERLKCDTVMMLALVHHLAIGNNVPLPDVANFAASLGRCALVEWVPKEDPQVQRLLRSREDIFKRYTEADFAAAFARRFRVLRREQIPDSGRALYLFEALAG